MHDSQPIPFPKSNPVVGDGSDVEQVDEATFVSLLTAHQGVLYSFLNTQLPASSSIDDIIQRTNLVLWKKRGQFEAGSNFNAWACSIARWEVRAWLSEQKRKDWLIFDDELADALMEQQVEEVTVESDKEEFQQLRDCLTQLSDKHRSLVLNYYIQGKSLKQCASLLGYREKSLKVLLFRLRSKLRECVTGQLLKKKEVYS